MAVIRRAAEGPRGSAAAQDLRIALIASGPDAAEDRDLVNRFCLPEVRRHCRGRDVAFGEVLLVSGAETARELTASHVASVLDTIRRDRPIVMCLLGHERGTPVPARVMRSRTLLVRHPWLEHLADDGLSLAEIAVLEGVLGNPMMNGRMLVAGRVAVRSGKRRSTDPLVRLTERLHAAGIPIVSGYEDRRILADRICQDLIALVDKHLPQSAQPSALEHMRRAQESFAASRRQAYVEVSSYAKRLDEHASSDGPPLVVGGETGAGKSALLANWIDRYRTRVPSAFVVVHYAGAMGPDGEHLAALRQIMVEIKERYAVSDEVPSTPREIVEEIPLWLARVQREKLILVLDGLDQLAPPSQDLEWLPRHIPPQVRLIVSASDGQVLDRLSERGWSELRLKPLTLSERRSVTREFLGERSRRLTGEQLRRVTNESTSANPLFLRIRLEELRAHGPSGRLNDRIDSFLDAGDLDKLFERVLERVERNHDEDLVRQAMTLLWASRRGLSAGDLEQLISADGAQLADLLGALDFHLISRDGLLTFFHDCMRQAVAARYDLADESHARAAHKTLAKFFAALPLSRRRATEEPWQNLRAGNHRKLRECIGSIDMFMELSSDETEYQLLGYWMALGSIEEMASVYEKNLATYERSTARSHPIALVLDRLGSFFYHAGLYQRAEPLLQRAVDTARNELGSSDPRAMQISKHLVELLLERGRYDESVAICRAVIDEVGPEHGDTHPMIIDALTMLSDALLYIDEFDLAEQSARRAVSACERVYGPEHPALAEALFNFAAILASRGDFAIAESLLRRVLSIDERVHGKDHPTTALTGGDLGSLLARTGRMSEAASMLREVLEVRERVLGPDHVHTGQSYHQLGQLLVSMEQFDESARYFEQAIRVFERTLGPEHRHYAASLGSLAGVRRNQGRLEDAESLYRRALAIVERTLGPEHSMAMFIRGGLGRTLLQAGRREEAEENLRMSFAWCQSALGPTHHNTLHLQMALSEVLIEAENLEEAEELMSGAIAGFRASFGERNIDTIRAHARLADIELRRGAIDRAVRRAADVLVLLDDIGAIGHNLAIEARRILTARRPENGDAALGAASLADIAELVS